MESPRVRIDRGYVENRNYYHKEYIEHIENTLDAIKNDTKRKERLSECLCPCCKYRGPRMAGQAFTKRQCAMCDTVIVHGNTDIDVLCPNCASRSRLCKHCGADIDLKNRRNRDLEDKACST